MKLQKPIDCLSDKPSIWSAVLCYAVIIGFPLMLLWLCWMGGLVDMDRVWRVVTHALAQGVR